MGKNQETIDAEMNALLSIIVPVYNTAPWLRRCLESLIGQTYRNLEIICVDDGSTDDSAAILDEYAARDTRIKVIHQENAGVSAARNRGLDIATGEYVTFVDADDWVKSEAYEKVVSQMADGVDIAWFGVTVEGELQPGYRQALEFHLLVNKTGHRRCTPELMNYIGGEMGNKIYRRSIILTYGLHFPEGLEYGEDKSFSYSFICAVSSILCVQDKFYHYCLRHGSAMSGYDNRKDKDKLARRVYDWVLSFVEKNKLQNKAISMILALLYGEYLDAALPKATDDERHEMYGYGRSRGYLKFCDLPSVLALRQQFMPYWEKWFHGFIQNREYYGIGKLRVFSITYEFERRVYRFMGRRLFSVCKKR